MDNTNIFDELLFLFKGVFFKEYVYYDQFDITITEPLLSTEYFSFVLPTKEFNQFDWDKASTIIDTYKTNGVITHFYLQGKKHSLFVEHFRKLGKEIESESLVYTNSAKYEEVSVPNIAIEELTENTLSDFATIADTCFPTYSNNKEYIKGFHSLAKKDSDKSQMNTFLLVDGKKAGIGQILFSLERKTAYFHNFAILPEYRRMGYFSAYKAMITNELISLGISTHFSINATGGNSYLANIKLGWKEFDQLHYVN